VMALVHEYTELVLDSFWNVKPVKLSVHQCITFATETNAVDTHTERDSVTDERRATQYLLRLLSNGEGNRPHTEKPQISEIINSYTECNNK